MEFSSSMAVSRGQTSSGPGSTQCPPPRRTSPAPRWRGKLAARARPRPNSLLRCKRSPGKQMNGGRRYRLRVIWNSRRSIRSRSANTSGRWPAGGCSACARVWATRQLSPASKLGRMRPYPSFITFVHSMRTNAVVAHGGGPTAVINASMAGLIEEQRRRGHGLYGARYGLAGLLRGELVDLLALDADLVRQIGEAPGSALGSSRLPLADEDYVRLLDAFRRAEVHTFFYTGGNGSMDTALRIARHARGAHYDLQVIGIPKTIDNDLYVNDHTPGYASTARFLACAARDVGEDNRSLPSPVCVLETLGRNAGWIVAATSLA